MVPARVLLDCYRGTVTLDCLYRRGRPPARIVVLLIIIIYFPYFPKTNCRGGGRVRTISTRASEENDEGGRKPVSGERARARAHGCSGGGGGGPTTTRLWRSRGGGGAPVETHRARRADRACSFGERRTEPEGVDGLPYNIPDRAVVVIAWRKFFIHFFFFSFFPLFFFFSPPRINKTALAARYRSASALVPVTGTQTAVDPILTQSNQFPYRVRPGTPACYKKNI